MYIILIDFTTEEIREYVNVSEDINPDEFIMAQVDLVDHEVSYLITDHPPITRLFKYVKEDQVEEITQFELFNSKTDD